MRQLSLGLAAHLASKTTTLARCWRIARTDGRILGFTDHDQSLSFSGISHEPAAGFTASDMPASLGLSVDTSDISGALVSAVLDEADLAAGLYDNARVEVWLVNWSEPGERLLLEVGSIGEITRMGSAFKAEIRSLAHTLDQERGRILSSTCDADFADARCGVDSSDPLYGGQGRIVEVMGPRRIRVSGPASVPAGYLARGSLRWTSGENITRRAEIRDDGDDGFGRILDLWEQPARLPAPGDTFNALAGCDKRLETCVNRYANAVNFRGFPFLPGNDFVAGYARSGENNDGGALI